jgi:hypothetical protein
LKKHAFLAVFDQNAWTIAHGFDRVWVIFTPFKLISIIFADGKTCIFGRFLPKSMDYSPWF